MHPPLKYSSDSIDDHFEVSGPRFDFVAERLPEILRREGSRAIDDRIELGNHLQAGSLKGEGRRLLTAIRTDYIGREVDRFFRMTKSARPSVVAVGRALFEEVVGVSEDSREGLQGTGLQTAVVACPDQQGGRTRFDHCFRQVNEDIVPNDPKFRLLGCESRLFRTGNGLNPA